MQHNPIRAIGIMVLGMALLAMSDAFIKQSSRHASLGQIMLMMSLGGTFLFVVVTRLRGISLWTSDARHPMVLLRGTFEIVGAIGMITSIAHVPLSVFAAIMQAAPLVVTLGASLFLGEQVGWRRWAAIAVGLIGMLIVIRPFGSGFTGYELFAVLGVSGLAARDLVTRLAPPHVPALFLSTWGFASTLIPGVLLLGLSGEAINWQPSALWPILGAIIVTTTGYFGVTVAMRMAPASIVSPFRYSRLIFTTGLGIAFFGDRPDFWTLVGAALILAAGLYSFLRERRLAQS
ncbi:DMT family transporter [Thalassococcus lentus]|uniref:DMT family transporter n=1 Tax=Thalassococcus lentus TaxID=1210524 RepID=A0ABT4XRP4_9RHOB|nr:DMT family transporter [Thalassococcus lentus]MDA7424624.1 DMT family transporter [Thalassococcus lentus]